MQALPAGSMLSVRLAAADARAAAPRRRRARRGERARRCAWSPGRPTRIAALEAELAADGVVASGWSPRTRSTRAMMDPVVEPLRDAAARRSRCRAPTIPILSTVTGDWLDRRRRRRSRATGRAPARAGAVRARGRARCSRSRAALLIEIGPRATLSALARQAIDRQARRARSRSPASPTRRSTRPTAIAAALGQLWTLGVAVDWNALRRATSAPPRAAADLSVRAPAPLGRRAGAAAPAARASPRPRRSSLPALAGAAVARRASAGRRAPSAARRPRRDAPRSPRSRAAGRGGLRHRRRRRRSGDAVARARPRLADADPARAAGAAHASASR